MLKDAAPNNTLVSQLKNKHKTMQTESTAFPHTFVGVAFLKENNCHYLLHKQYNIFTKQYNLLSRVKISKLVFHTLLTFHLLTG